MDRKWAAMAELYARQIKRLRITAATEVSLVFHGTDAGGQPVAPVRQSVTPAETLRGPYQTDLARAFALNLHVDVICDNIRAHLLRLQQGTSLPNMGCPDFPVIVHDVRLEIEEPDEIPS